MASTKTKQKWIMPEWMAKYVEHFSNTGGWMKPEDAMNCDSKDCNMFANAPRAILCCSVAAQTRLLLRLHAKGLIE